MTIRTFLAGDEAAQVSIYNEVAASFPRFKPATLDEVRRKMKGAHFDPSLRFYAVTAGRVVGYTACQPSGRISFPWCRKGYEQNALPLLEQAEAALRSRGVPTAFAAYRADWPQVCNFFQEN